MSNMTMKHRNGYQHMRTLQPMTLPTGSDMKSGLPVSNELTRDYTLRNLGKLQYTDTTPMGAANTD